MDVLLLTGESDEEERRAQLVHQAPGAGSHIEGGMLEGPRGKLDKHLGQDPACQEKQVQTLHFLALAGLVGSGSGSGSRHLGSPVPSAL